MPADRLLPVARDLALLAGRDRRAILAALAPEDRERVLRTMRGRHQASPAPRRTPHSLWLETLVDEARRKVRPMLTAAARTALLDVADRDGSAAASSRPPGRTLLHAAGSLLAPARAR